jgi:PTS system nitrogen regulatory IIA component
MNGALMPDRPPGKLDGRRRNELADCLNPARVDVDLHVSSKKRLLEEVAGHLTRESSGLNKDTIFQVLTERERLGSTGIGSGIALPHGRVSGIREPIATALRLKTPLDFDAIDQKPVSIVIGLIVPADADRKHLQILACLARMFSDESLRESLARCSDASTFHDILTSWPTGDA